MTQISRTLSSVVVLIWGFACEKPFINSNKVLLPPTTSCGNGVPDRGEQCDDGRDNSDTIPGACRTDCRQARCGDGVVDGASENKPAEECDDGNESDSDSCLTNCTHARCGDGEIWEGREECDNGDSANANTRVCKSDCTNQYCGDGFRGPGERCDEGAADTVNCDYDDGVSVHACTLAECGDGYVNAEANELCDKGPRDTESCNFAGGGLQGCTVSFCGDGYRNLAAGEQCDDGPDDSRFCDYDGGLNSQACTLPECGDGYLNEASGEACDDGQEDTDGCDYHDGTSFHACTLAECGDAYHNRQAGEECDPGLSDSDNCDFARGNSSESCSLATCGDGYPNFVAGEQCDDGNEGNEDGCPDGAGGACVPQVCGDGFVGPGEECDEGAGDTSGCDFAGGTSLHSCTFAFCGDGYTNPSNAESCDDGNTEDNDGCNPLCLPFISPPAPLNGNTVDDRSSDRSPQVATDGKGTWVAVWEGDRGILVARSRDGVTWSFPSLLPQRNNLNINRAPRLATDGLGTWLVVWYVSSEFTANSGVVVARSTNSAATWSDPIELEPYSPATRYSSPAIATNSTGDWIIAWSSKGAIGDNDRDILFARSTNNGVDWTTPTALNSNASGDSGDDRDPYVATDSSGKWVTVWSSEDTSSDTIGSDWDTLVSRSDDGGMTWSSPQTLDPTEGVYTSNDKHPRVATGGSGKWVAVWETVTNRNESYVLVSQSDDGGASWTPPKPLNTNANKDSHYDMQPQIVTDGAGEWIVVWGSTATRDDEVGTDGDIFLSRSDDDGASWTKSQTLNSNAGEDKGRDESPQLTTDGAGNWLAVWSSNEDLRNIGTDKDILVAHSSDTGKTWSFPKLLMINAGADSGADYSPRITTDGAGNWVAVWSSDDTLRDTVGNDRDILVARSTDNGVTWSFPAMLNTNAASDDAFDHRPEIATDRSGVWITVWHSANRHVYVASSIDNGVTWNAPIPLATGDNVDLADEGYPQIATDGSGVWVVVWTADGENRDGDVLFARSSNNGASWTRPLPILPIDTNDAFDTAPNLATNAAGTWIALWWSVGTRTEILFARSTDNGVNWSSPAPLNTNAETYMSFAPDLIADRQGNWVAVWSSFSLHGFDLWTTRSVDNGENWNEPALLYSDSETDRRDDIMAEVALDDRGHMVALWRSVWRSVDDYEETQILVSRSTDYGSRWTSPTPLSAITPEDPFTNSASPHLTTDGNGHWIAVWASRAALQGIGTDTDVLFTTLTFPVGEEGLP